MSERLSARCRMPHGGVSEIEILDINEAGCLANKSLIRMEDGDRLLLKLPGLEHMAAYVAWVEEDQVGLTFEQPLYGPVLQHLLANLREPFAA